MSSSLEERAAARSVRTRYPVLTRFPNPALGAEFSLAVPGGTIWIPRVIRAVMTTSGTVINRLLQVTIDDGTTVFYSNGASAVQAQSTTTNYNLTTAVTQSYAATADLLIPLPLLQLGAGFRIRSVTSNIQAGDQWSGLVVYAIEVQTTSLARAEAEALIDDPPAWADYLS